MSDTLTVGAIEEVVKRDEKRLYVNLSDVKVADSGAEVLVTDDEGNKHSFEFDEVAERTLSDFLDVNPTYMRKCPGEIKAYNLNYWLRQDPEVRAVIMAGPKGIETMHDPDSIVVTVPEVAGVISRVFEPSDRIVNIWSDPTKFHADIMVSSSITVPGNGVGDRPDAEGYLRRPGEVDDEGNEKPAIKVFDVTHGGVRILSHPSRPHAPVVQRYFNRLICNNGLTMPVVDNQITLKGHTLPEVLADMEQAAEQLLSTMDEALEKYAELSDLVIPGNPLAYIRQVGTEAGIPNRIILKALDYAGAYNLADQDRITSYDVANIFTSLANNDSVRYSTAVKLQEFGGSMVVHGEEMVRRCSSCERVLPHFTHD